MRKPPRQPERAFVATISAVPPRRKSRQGRRVDGLDEFRHSEDCRSHSSSTLKPRRAADELSVQGFSSDQAAAQPPPAPVAQMGGMFRSRVAVVAVCESTCFAYASTRRGQGVMKASSWMPQRRPNKVTSARPLPMPFVSYQNSTRLRLR